MLFDMNQLTGRERYKLLASSIAPRPIAWVTSMSANGVLNAAPFSSFNMMGHTPPLLVLGIQKREDDSYKDTCSNIVATGELVVNLVTESDTQAMSDTSIDAPPDFDEIAAAGIAVSASSRVAPPRIATAPVSFECKTFQVLQPGPRQMVILCEILLVHVEDRFIVDPASLQLDTPAMRLVGRMHSPHWYLRSTDLVQVVPPPSPPKE